MKPGYFTNKNILIISPESWQHLFISKHHYAIELGKRNKVFFLNPPGQPTGILKTNYENVSEINYEPFIGGLRFLPAFVQRFFMRQKYNAIEKLAAVEFDVVWSFDNSVFFDFSFLPDNVFTISHIMDYSQDFQLAMAAKTARLCMGVSQNIVDLLKVHNKNSFLIGHGIALDRAKSIDVTLPGENKIKAIFAGNLDRKHFDREILLRLAQENPAVDFIFYGSGGKTWQRYKNTYYPGIVDSALLPGYLQKADVLLLAYKVDEYPLELTNSHKVLEYLASGNIIVSSYLADYSDKQSLLKMVNKASDFPAFFAEVISNLSFYNSREAKEARKSFARQNTYSQRLTEIESIVERIQ